MILDILHNNGFKAYIVGGCVRDSIMGIVPHDWDITTDALPNDVKNIFKDFNIIDTGLKHGTVAVIINKSPYEITTFRVDGSYSDGRHPDNVTFTTKLEEDLSRRDFTINAIAFNYEEGLIDPYDGETDIINGRIRCVGSPLERFNEDALRILRALRFAAQFNFKIDPCIDNTIQSVLPSINNLSMERIGSEFSKIIVSHKNAAYVLKEYHNVLFTFIPELQFTYGFMQNHPYHKYDVFMHTINALESYYDDLIKNNKIKCECDLIVSLSILFHDIGKPHSYQDDIDTGIRHFRGHAKISAEITDKIMHRLRFDNDTREKVVQLVLHHDSEIPELPKSVKRMLNKIGPKQYRRLLYVQMADIKAQNPKYYPERSKKIQNAFKMLDDVISQNSCFKLKQLAINGTDLIEVGFKQGKEIGIILDMILSKVISNELQNKKEVLLNFAKTKFNKLLLK